VLCDFIVWRTFWIKKQFSQTKPYLSLSFINFSNFIRLNFSPASFICYHFTCIKINDSSTFYHSDMSKTENRCYYHPHFVSSTVDFLLVARISMECRVWPTCAKLHKGVSYPKFLLDNEESRYTAFQCQIRMPFASLLFLPGKNWQKTVCAISKFGIKI